MFCFCCLMFVEGLALVSAIIPTTRDRQSGLQPGLGIHSSALSFFRSRHILKKSSGSDSLPSLFTKERFVLFTMLFPFFYVQNNRANRCKRQHSLPSLIKKDRREPFTHIARCKNSDECDPHFEKRKSHFHSFAL